MTVKTARLDLRLTDAQKTRVERAAALRGSTTAGFAVASLLDAAAAVIADESEIALSEEIWVEFTAALDAPDSESWKALRATEPVWGQ
ncbi:MAG: DUF1778 domain-containing protein [Propionibacteriaceae bacterium]|jgi:uncharacterized protein (DUF1778 family)|nr:DUF1778 domain-containing protein [Propionibacteriaceae bacterium]